MSRNCGGDKGGAARPYETRKWNEGPSSEVKGMETLIAEALAKIKPTDPLRLAKSTSV